LYLKSQNTNFVFSDFFPRKSYYLRHNVEKYGTVRKATDDSIPYIL